MEKVSKAFKRYARSFRIEIIDSKDPSVQLTTSKSSIKDLFKDLLDEIKGFKFQITIQVFLSKHKENGDIEFAPVYFNSTTKTVINFKIILINLFKKFFTELIIELMKDGWRICQYFYLQSIIRKFIQ